MKIDLLMHRNLYSKQTPFLLLILACMSFHAPRAIAVMELQSFSPQKHFRFYTGGDKDFIGAAYDSSGLGRSTTNGGWATMISEHYFVTSAHALPFTGNSNPLRFYQTNDPNGPYEDHVYLTAGEDPLNGQFIGEDLWLGKLKTAPSAAIARYSLLGLANPSDYDNLELYTYGKDFGIAGDTTSMRLGRNNFDAGSISSSTDGVFSFTNDTPGLGDDESYVFQGDSGAPTFVVVNGQFTLVGLHWFKSSTASFDTFVPRWITELNAAMASGGEQVSVVASIPEPSALVLIVLGSVPCFTRRRKSA